MLGLIHITVDVEPGCQFSSYSNVFLVFYALIPTTGTPVKPLCLEAASWLSRALWRESLSGRGDLAGKQGGWLPKTLPNMCYWLSTSACPAKREYPDHWSPWMRGPWVFPKQCPGQTKTHDPELPLKRSWRVVQSALCIVLVLDLYCMWLPILRPTLEAENTRILNAIYWNLNYK